MEIIVDICKQILYVTNLVVQQRIPEGPPVLHKYFSIAKPRSLAKCRMMASSEAYNILTTMGKEYLSNFKVSDTKLLRF